MKLRKMHEHEPLPTIEDIENLEKELKIQIPDNYKKILLETDGGFPIKGTLYKFKENEGYNMVNKNERFFYYETPTTGFNSLSRIDSRFDPGYFPLDMIPISNNGIGDHICISTEKERYGKIYILAHEEMNEQEGDEPDYYGFYYVCESLEVFINSMEKYSGDEE